jgi:chromosome segregation ATPase
MADEYPTWLEPHPSHKFYKLPGGELQHSSGLEYSRDRVSRKVMVLAHNDTEKRSALETAIIDKHKEALAEAEIDNPNISLEQLVDNLARIRMQCPGLFGPAIEQLSDRIAELGSLDAYADSLGNQITEQERRLTNLKKQAREQEAKTAELVVQAERQAEQRAREITDAAKTQVSERMAADQKREQQMAGRISQAETTLRTLTDAMTIKRDEIAAAQKKHDGLVAAIATLKEKFG